VIARVRFIAAAALAYARTSRPGSGRRGLGRLDRVDHVAAVGGRPARRCSSCAAWRTGRDAPDLDDGHRRAVGQDDRHLQQRADRPAQVLLGVVDEGLGAVAALQEERLAAGDLAEPALEPVDLGRAR
jgi:hypothetical protein